MRRSFFFFFWEGGGGGGGGDFINIGCKPLFIDMMQVRSDSGPDPGGRGGGGYGGLTLTTINL